jgi:hypothetical protein
MACDTGIRGFSDLSKQITQPHVVRFEVFTAVAMKNAIFWDVGQCGSCRNGRFGGKYHLHQGKALDSFHPDYGAIGSSKRRFLQQPLGVTSPKMVYFSVM